MTDDATPRGPDPAPHQAPGPGSVRALLGKALSLVGARVAGNVLTLGYTLLLARLVPPAEFGWVMTGFAWTMLLSVGLALNVESGAIRYLVRYRDADRPGAVAGFIRFNLWLVLGATALTALVAAAVWATGLLDAGTTGVQVFALALLAAPVVALTRIYGRHATALGQVLRGGLPVMLVRPAVICALLGAFWLAGAEPGVPLLMILLLAAFVATALVQAALLRHTFAFARRAAPDYSDIRPWLGTGFAMAPLLVLRDNLKHVIVAAAGLTLGAAAVGHVALALSVMTLFYFGMKAVDIALSPALSQALQGARPGRVRHLLGSAAKVKLAGLAVAVAMVALGGRAGIGLFGPGYGDALAPLAVLMLIPATEALFGPAQVVLNVTGRQGAVFRVAGISAIVLVAATAAGGWLAGAEGAAAGAGLSYALQQALLRRTAWRETGVDTSAATLWRRPGARE